MFKILIAATFLLSCTTSTQSNNNNTITMATAASIHQFSVPALNGSTINFAQFKGKKILIVNTASECGYTPQYKELQALYLQYQQKLVVVGFPANDFGGQEPGSNSTIQTFCEKNYGVTFPMAAKVAVKGDSMAPIFKWLTTKALNQVMDANISWNFNKFLLDENGVLLQKFDSDVTPLSSDITSLL